MQDSILTRGRGSGSNVGADPEQGSRWIGGPPSIEGDHSMDTLTQNLRARLESLAQNLCWCWKFDVAGIFRDIDPDRWARVHHDPLAFLRQLDDDTLGQSVRKRDMQIRIDEAWRDMQAYLKSPRTWGATEAGVLRPSPVAYFSAEFGIHESLPIYSGGLGVLSGDHLKSASDLDLPLVGIGLLYREGYFKQTIDRDGRQQEEYPVIRPEELPMTALLSDDGTPVTIAVETRTGVLHARVWEVLVGRIRLFLLDSDTELNTPEDRQLTSRLYGGSERTRIRQELLLGIGGVRALDAAGIRPGVLHLNEGHSAFAALETVARKMEREGRGFAEVSREVAGHVVFTTHTPVPAGHDRFSRELLLEHLGPLQERLHLDDEGLLALGRDASQPDLFTMTVLALKLSQRANGVSALHGHVSRHMWQSLWPGRAEHEVPIGHITNGVHVPSWVSPAMTRLYDRHLPQGWEQRQEDPETWAAIYDVDDELLWDACQSIKADFASYVRAEAASQAERRGESAEVVQALRGALTEGHLLVGFARRFATYKRATLVAQDLDTLDEMVNHPERPMRFVFAGKAHPKDEGGKGFLQELHRVSRDPRFLGKLVVLEGYDIEVGRHIVAGVDVWLNNPRRPHEASGTSGQKVVLNGGLNCSILDGWWAEGWDGENGFAIGTGDVHRDVGQQDVRDSEALLTTLRDHAAGLYYDRDEDGIPRGWIHRMKRSIATLGWRFNADRMVLDYARLGYLPAGGGVLAEARVR